MNTYILLFIAFTLPFIGNAQVTTPRNFAELLGMFNGLIGLLIPLIFALTAFTIFWGVIRAWIMGDASQDDIDRGKKTALVGVIALTIMISIWGILRFLQSSIFG